MHYDFIEIGTSDFDTAIQSSNEDAVGICVEPVQAYLDKLPSRLNVKKICAAISQNNTRGKTYVFFVPPEKIQELGLPEWLKGCNSVGNHHFQHIALGVRHLTCQEEIREMPLSDLFLENNVTSVNLLKIDTEGNDCRILTWFFVDIVVNPAIAPKQIIFESNALTNKDELDVVLNLYTAFGYTVKSINGDNVELHLNP
jgi:hypothetical protein